MTRSIIAVFAFAACLVAASPAVAAPPPTAPLAPEVTGAPGPDLPLWQEFVYRRVRFRMYRHELRLLSEGRVPYASHVEITYRTEIDIHLTAIVDLLDGGSRYRDSIRCNASLFGGGDFPRARVIRCDHWTRVPL